MSVHVKSKSAPDADGALLSRRILSVVIAGGLLLSIMLVAGVTWFVESGRTHAREEARRELLTLSRALAEDTDRTLQGAEALEAGVLARLQSTGVASAPDLARAAGAFDFHRFLADKISEVLYLEALAVADAQGNILSDSHAWPAPDVNVSDRDYFQSLANNPRLSSMVGNPTTGKVVKSWTMKLTKPIVGSDGRFLGLVLASIKVSYSKSAYSSFIMPGGRVSLFRNTGVLMARAPHINDEFGKRYDNDPFFDGRDTRSEGVVIISHDRDSRPPHDVAFERLARYPLVMTVSRSHPEIEAEWNGLARVFYLAAAGWSF